MVKVDNRFFFKEYTNLQHKVSVEMQFEKLDHIGI